MSRPRSNILKECVSSHNTIDFVQNPLPMAGQLSGEILEGPPAFLESQGIRYVPAPVGLEANALPPLIPDECDAVKTTLSAKVSEMNFEDRVSSAVRNCLKAQANSSIRSYGNDRPTSSSGNTRNFSEASRSYPRPSETNPYDSLASMKQLHAEVTASAPSRRQLSARGGLDDDYNHSEMQRLHAEIMASDPRRQLSSRSSASSMSKLHAEIMASAPKPKLSTRAVLPSRVDNVSNRLNAGFDNSDDEDCCAISHQLKAPLRTR